MNAPYFVEVIGRNGEVKHRQQVSTLPIRIGRGYDNDFILDDPHTSANHVVIQLTENGGLEVRDLDSRNGLIHKGHRHNRILIDGNTVFRIGHTSLRIRSADFKVGEEIPDTAHHGWEGWPPAFAGLLLLALLSWVSAWMADTEKSEPAHYLTVFLSTFSVGVVWSGAWSLANRLFAGHTRFGRHLFITASGLVLLEVAGQLCGVAAYVFSIETFTRYATHVQLAGLAGMVYFQLLTISPSHTRRYALTAVIAFILISGVILMLNYKDEGRLSDELYMSELLPPVLRISSDKQVEQFIVEARQLKDKVDAERAKDVKSDSEEGGD